MMDGDRRGDGSRLKGTVTVVAEYLFSTPRASRVCHLGYVCTQYAHARVRTYAV